MTKSPPRAVERVDFRAPPANRRAPTRAVRDGRAAARARVVYTGDGHGAPGR